MPALRRPSFLERKILVRLGITRLELLALRKPGSRVDDDEVRSVVLAGQEAFAVEMPSGVAYPRGN